MDEISTKAKIVYAALQELEATNYENKVTSYAVLDYIIEEGEQLHNNPLLADIPEDIFMDIGITINIKAIATILTSLANKKLIARTEPTTMTVDGTKRQLRQYYIN